MLTPCQVNSCELHMRALLPSSAMKPRCGPWESWSSGLGHYAYAAMDVYQVRLTGRLTRSFNELRLVIQWKFSREA